MQAATQTGIEAWVPRRAMMVTGIAAWAGGLVLAVVAGWYTVHVRTATHATEEATPAWADTAESQETLVLAADVVVAARPHDGVTQKQKP
jgi:hypothetical protein